MDELKNPNTVLAAERTLLAWNRTCLSLMGFGFLIERFDLFLHDKTERIMYALYQNIPFWIGMGFIVLGVGMTLIVLMQYHRVFQAVRAETGEHFGLRSGLLLNGLTAVLGLGLIVYLLSNVG